MLLRLVIFTICLCAFSAITRASDNIVTGLIVSGLEQKVDDEEAPFDIHSSNKIHNCGGKPSNVYRIYSEYDAVAQRRFLLALEAYKSGMPLTVYTDGCEGRVLKIHSLRLTR
jgi:hypothetical protein